MAPRGRRATEATEEPQAFHQFGVRGRKTGVALPTTGEVDEQGFQPLDAIFSSPTKPSQSDNRNDDDDDEDDDGGSEDMEIASSAGPGPRTLLKEQRSLQYPLPRSRSPIKTTLLSPARRNPHLERLSSPMQPEDRETTVTRKINFPSRATGKGKPGARTNGHGINGAVPESDEEEEEPEDAEQDAGNEDVEDDDSIEMVGAQDDAEDEPPVDYQDDAEEGVEDEPITREPQTAKRGRGRPRTSLDNISEPSPAQDSAKKHRGRPPKSAKKAAAEKVVEEESQPVRGSRKRRSLLEDDTVQSQPEPEEPEEEEAPRQTKRQRITQEPKAAAKPKKTTTKPEKVVKPKAAKAEAPAPKAKGRPKAKAAQTDSGDADVGEASFMALQKGPPMPKRRGLVSIKRDPDVIVQTRAGRQSYRPLHWWAGDKVITEVEERKDFGQGDFVTSSTKEVFRAPEEDTKPSRATRGKGRSKNKLKNQMQQIEEEQEPPEDWEIDRGVIEGEVMTWEPEHERHPPSDDDQVNVSEDLLAISGDAVRTKEISDTTFRFAKTLTTPFMGAGIVDLPPGAEKRPKNSRKMHMVFFVHTGKVLVTVNETEFRISAGGQWFVPRGNYYSITNDYDRDARIFFAQANQVASN